MHAQAHRSVLESLSTADDASDRQSDLWSVPKFVRGSNLVGTTVIGCGLRLRIACICLACLSQAGGEYEMESTRLGGTVGDLDCLQVHLEYILEVCGTWGAFGVESAGVDAHCFLYHCTIVHRSTGKLISLLVVRSLLQSLHCYRR
jgi:hypothetical protein